NFCTINGLLGCPSIRCANSRSLEVLHLTLETAPCRRRVQRVSNASGMRLRAFAFLP
ncbi:pectate lyase, partial [Xanthomonas oryzae pv. oryzae]